MQRNQFQLLQKRRFYPLFITQFLGAFNDNTFKNALVIFIPFSMHVFSSHQIEFLLTIGSGLFILPFFLFSATAGQLADRFQKPLLIQFTKLAEIIIMLFAAFAFYIQSTTLLFFALFLMGTQSAFFWPIKICLTPRTLK